MKEQNLQSHCQPDHGGVPIAIGNKVETKPSRAGTDGGTEGTSFIIQLPAKEN